MPKSLNPLAEQLTPTSAQQTPNMTDNTTGAADKLGANKDTNAIPQGVRHFPSHPSMPTYQSHHRYDHALETIR
jgi:hypothetical protein